MVRRWSGWLSFVLVLSVMPLPVQAASACPMPSAVEMGAKRSQDCCTVRCRMAVTDRIARDHCQQTQHALQKQAGPRQGSALDFPTLGKTHVSLAMAALDIRPEPQPFHWAFEQSLHISPATDGGLYLLHQTFLI